MAKPERRRRRTDPFVLACAGISLLCAVVVAFGAAGLLDTSRRVERGLCVVVRTIEASELRDRRLILRAPSTRARRARKRSAEAYERLSRDLRAEVNCPRPAQPLRVLRGFRPPR